MISLFLCDKVVYEYLLIDYSKFNLLEDSRGKIVGDSYGIYYQTYRFGLSKTVLFAIIHMSIL